jgi:hypothetical protein
MIWGAQRDRHRNPVQRILLVDSVDLASGKLGTPRRRDGEARSGERQRPGSRRANISATAVATVRYRRRSSRGLASLGKFCAPVSKAPAIAGDGVGAPVVRLLRDDRDGDSRRLRHPTKG